MPYLLKTEPPVYSFADLQSEGATIWDGVSNPVAVKNLRGMKAGEQLVIYHTGDDKSAVGTATVVSVDATDPKNPQVKIQAAKALAKPVFRHRLVLNFHARADGIDTETIIDRLLKAVPQEG